MESLLEAIRASFGSDATDETRAAGAHACRTILASLEPMPEVQPVSTPAISQLIGALRGVPADQLLDLAIARLRAALPTEDAVAPAQSIKFRLVPVPQQPPGTPR
jgi:hypothetical protein